MGKPIKKIHLHEEEPPRSVDYRGNITGSLCDRYKPEAEVVPVQWFRDWVHDGKSGEFYCGDCIRTVEEGLAS